MDVIFSGLHTRQHYDQSIYPRICSLLRRGADRSFIYPPQSRRISSYDSSERARGGGVGGTLSIEALSLCINFSIYSKFTDVARARAHRERRRIQPVVSIVYDLRKPRPSSRCISSGRLEDLALLFIERSQSARIGRLRRVRFYDSRKDSGSFILIRRSLSISSPSFFTGAFVLYGVSATFIITSTLR